MTVYGQPRIEVCMGATVPTRADLPGSRIGALRAETQAVLQFCAGLSPEEWNAPSRAAGWRVRDVIAHLGSSCRLMFSLQMLEVLRTQQVERFHDKLVAERDARSPNDLLTEYRTWSSRVAKLLSVSIRRPLGSLPVRIGELGWYPTRLLPSAMTFDAHTHLRHDIALALDRPVPPTDDQRMTCVVEWLLALLEKLNAESRTWLDRPVLVSLTGSGGGAWRLEPAGGGRLQIQPHMAERAGDAAAAISGASADFPIWTTRRTSWRDCSLTLDGDTAYASRFLDTVHLV